MTDIELHAKSDRELLMMAVQRLNSVCTKIEKHDLVLYNEGWAQVKGLLILVGASWAMFLIWFGNHIRKAIGTVG
jgi:hypothetical protein